MYFCLTPQFDDIPALYMFIFRVHDMMYIDTEDALGHLDFNFNFI